MAYDVPSYLSRDGSSLIFNKNDQEFIFYVPEKFFDTKNAKIIGQYVEVFGLLDFQIVSKTGKPLTPIKHFIFPTVFTTKPDHITVEKGLTLNKNAKPYDYRIFHYNKGDKVVVDVMVPQNISTVEAFYNLFNRGNLPPSIPYDKIYNIYNRNMQLSGNKYGFTGQLFGLIFSEVYRSKKDINVPFRLSGTDDMQAYQTIPLTEVPKRISPYVSLTSENWDNSVVGAIQTKDAKDSPLEDVLTT